MRVCASHLELVDALLTLGVARSSGLLEARLHRELELAHERKRECVMSETEEQQSVCVRARHHGPVRFLRTCCAISASSSSSKSAAAAAADVSPLLPGEE